MQIALYSTILSRGGAERYIAYLSKYLSKKNIPHLLLLDRDEITYQYGDSAEVIILRDYLKVFRIIFPNRLIDIIALRRIRFNRKFSSLISGTDKSIVNSVFISKCKKISVCQNNLSRKYLDISNSLLRKISLYFLRKGFNRSSFKFAVSEGVLKSMRDFSIEGKIYNTRNCVDREHFSENENYITNPLNLKLINVGNLIEQKNHKLLIRIIKSLKDQNIEVSLEILGEGELRTELTDYIKELELEKNVTLLGFITKEAYLKTLKSADIFILTSIFEGMPLAILEAMSVGLPIIANDCESGPREILDNGKFGKLIEFNNEKSFVNAVNEVKENYLKFSNLSKKRASYYEYDKIFDDFFESTELIIK
tara:strand:- start:21735 stop:22832 length:1098 start_codon:yes stop_codon:yes gene_type:complete